MKSSDEVKKLQRSLKRLRTAGGRPLRVGGHLFVVHASTLLDPERLLSAIGAPLQEAEARALLRETLLLREPKLLDPVAHVDARWLGEVWRDYKLFRDHPDSWEILRKQSRYFREPPEPRDLPIWRAQLDLLNALHSSPPSPVKDPLDQIFALARAFHGDECARHLATLHARSLKAQRGHLRDGRRRLALALRMFQGGESRAASEEEHAFLSQQVALLAELRRLPGRARRKKLGPIVARLVLGPTAGELSIEIPEDLCLADAVEDALVQIASWLQQQLPFAPGFPDELRKILATYGLRCPPTREPEPLDAGQVARMTSAWERLREALGDRSFSFEQAAGLALRLGRCSGAISSSLNDVVRWIEGGLSMEELDLLDTRPELHPVFGYDWDVATLRAYLRWVEIFHHHKINMQEALDPSSFLRLWSQQQGDLTVLATSLVAASSQGNSAQSQLDLLLAMAHRLPVRARECLQVLYEEQRGLGKQHARGLAAWLGDDALLDRYLQLRGALGEPVEVARGLLRDFHREESRQRQIAHLLASASLEPAQSRALQALTQAEDPVGRGWTLRRLRDRIGPLSARLLQSTLDRVLKQVFREVFHLDLPLLDERWRDVARLALSLDKNKTQLTLLLRTSLEHPGVYVVPSLPRNQAWLERAKARMNVDAWLQRRRVAVTIGDRPFSLEIEEDPMEALRMGVPFDTCLSLQGGSNAHSAILNALDVNKRVLYLRAPDRAVVARKLLAISPDFHLLGYRLYSSLPLRLLGEVQAAFRAFSDELCGELGIEYGNSGVPESIHDGSWYDDGVAAWDGSSERSREGVSPEELAACCRALGLPVPEGGREPPAEIRCLRAQEARDCRELAKSLSYLHSWSPDGSYLNSEFCRWIRSEMGDLARLTRAACQADGWMFHGVVLHLSTLEGYQAILGALRAIGVDELGYNVPGERLSQSFGPAIFSDGLSALGRQYFERRDRVDFAGVSSMFRDADSRLMGLSMKGYFDLCDALQSAQEDVLRCSSKNNFYFDWNASNILALAPLIFLLEPEAPQVVRCLDSTRRSPLAVRAAAQIAALFSFSLEDRGLPTLALFLGLTRQDSLRLNGALLRRLRVQPTLEEEPEVAAAFVAPYCGIFDEFGPWEPLFFDDSSLQQTIKQLSEASPCWALTWGVLVRLWRVMNTPSGALLSWTKKLLAQAVITEDLFAFTPVDVVARMATQESLFRGMIERLDSPHWWNYSKYSEPLEQQAARMGLDVEPFLSRWAASVGKIEGGEGWSHSTVPVFTSREQVQKLFRRLILHAPPACWLPLYRRFHTACECALVLGELRASGKLEATRKWLAEHSDNERADGYNDFWLEALLRESIS